VIQLKVAIDLDAAELPDARATSGVSVVDPSPN